MVLRPNCSRSGAVENEEITISSELLASPVSGSESSQLQLPPTLFSDALGGETYDCSDVGIVAVVYNGAGPLYSLNGSSLLPTPDCEAPLANGRWWVLLCRCIQFTAVFTAWSLPVVSGILSLSARRCV